jgi:2-deoxy-D-gluconate 3-dehydrogenase
MAEATGTAQLSVAELFDLSGQVAVVTGGAMGIGQAIVFRLAVTQAPVSC